MSRSRAGKGRWVGWVVVVFGLAAVTVRNVFLVGGDPTLDVAMAGAALAGLIIVVISGRREFKSGGTSDVGPLCVQAGLVFSAMPQDWQRLIFGAADPKARRRGGLTVKVCVADDWLVIDRVWDPLLYFEPLEARFPIAAVTDVVVGAPVVALIGSTLTFQLASGGEVRFDVQAGAALAERVAQRFRDAATSARATRSAPSPALELVSGRTSMELPPSEAEVRRRASARYYKITGSMIFAMLLFVAGFAAGSIGRQSADHRATKAEAALTSSDTRANTLQTQLDKTKALLEVVQTDAAQSVGDGIYRVGRGVKAGLYHTTGMPNCYWAKLSSSNPSDIVDNGVSGGPQTITIDSLYFITKGCGTSSKMG